MARQHHSYTDWKPIVLNPRAVDSHPIELFDDVNVENLQLWMGACGPSDSYTLRFKVFVDLKQEALDALKEFGRDPQVYAWPIVEQYDEIRVRQPTPSSPWSVTVGEETVSSGWLLQVDQKMVGRVKAEILQSGGTRRLLLYRLVRRG